MTDPFEIPLPEQTSTKAAKTERAEMNQERLFNALQSKFPDLLRDAPPALRQALIIRERQTDEERAKQIEKAIQILNALVGNGNQSVAAITATTVPMMQNAITEREVREYLLEQSQTRLDGRVLTNGQNLINGIVATQEDLGVKVIIPAVANNDWPTVNQQLMRMDEIYDQAENAGVPVNRMGIITKTVEAGQDQDQKWLEKYGGRFYGSAAEAGFDRERLRETARMLDQTYGTHIADEMFGTMDDSQSNRTTGQNMHEIFNRIESWRDTELKEKERELIRRDILEDLETLGATQAAVARSEEVLRGKKPDKEADSVIHEVAGLITPTKTDFVRAMERARLDGDTETVAQLSALTPQQRREYVG